jgi:hypothetical protein
MLHPAGARQIYGKDARYDRRSRCPYFKPVDQRWRLEYRRIRQLGGGDYWEGCRVETRAVRSEISPYALGIADHRSLRDATQMHNPRPPVCAFAGGTPEKAEYERGWNDFARAPIIGRKSKQ